MSTTKIVINSCYGGFGLSDDAIEMLLSRKGIEFNEPGKEEYSLYQTIRDINRADPDLVYVVETLGKRASGDCAELTIKELPVGTHYRIREYDGYESIETRDEIKWEVA